VEGVQNSVDILKKLEDRDREEMNKYLETNRSQ
jgi:hypothetical protein